MQISLFTHTSAFNVFVGVITVKGNRILIQLVQFNGTNYYKTPVS